MRFRSIVFLLLVFIIVGIVLYRGGFLPFSRSVTSSDIPRIIPEVSFEPTTPSVEVAPITYTALVLSTNTPGKELIDAVGRDNLTMTLSLNRVDEHHLRKGQTIVYPSRFDDPTALTAFPITIPELAAVPKIMLIAQRVQEFGAYEYGTLVRFGGLSSGKESTPTANKLYYTNWKGKEVISTINEEWLLKWNFNIDNFDGIGIHQYELPGYPASHSCVRLSEADAMWFYEWADQWTLTADGQRVAKKGTPVLIFGDYDFDASAPWKALPQNTDALKITPEELRIETLIEELTLSQ